MDCLGRIGQRGLEGLPGFNKQDEVVVPAEGDFDSRGTEHLVERIKHRPRLGVVAYQERDVRAGRGFDFVGFTVEHGFVCWGVKLFVPEDKCDERCDAHREEKCVCE